MESDLNDPDFKAAYETIVSGLTRGLRENTNARVTTGTPHNHRPRSHESSRNELRIKCEYQGEKRAMHMTKPVNYTALVSKIKDYYGTHLQIHYSVPNAGIICPVSTQQELDHAVSLVDKNERLRTTLRLLLTRPAGRPEDTRPPGALGELFGGPNNENHVKVKPSHRGKTKSKDRDSPPPGTLPASQHRMERSTSHVSTEGEFIPERGDSRQSPDGSLSHSDSFSSLENSSYCSSKRGGSVRSIRSVVSDSIAYEHSSSSGDDKNRGGTYPRAKQHPGGSKETVMHGSQSFPKHGRQPEFANSLSMYKGGSSRTPSNSTSSSSSDLLASDKYDHIAMSMNQLTTSSKSPHAPTNWKKGNILGAGAFGQVFLCYDEDTGRELAVKQVQIGTRTTEISKEVRALQCELQLLKNLQHPRIVQYFGSEEGDRVLSIFMEYVPCGSLKDHIRKYGALTERVARKCTTHVLEGLAYLHKLMIVHRDIKGANILRDHSGNVKLGDFGASKRLQTICTSSNAATVTGTPYWMAPEVINGEGYGRKADIWSLGCTVVEMLTTFPPWHDFEAMAAIFKIATSEFPKYELPRNTADFTKEFLKECFQRDQHLRKSAEELLKTRFPQET